MKTISQATVYLQRHELFTLEDLDIALQGVSEKATAIREDMQKAANRMKANPGRNIQHENGKHHLCYRRSFQQGKQGHLRGQDEAVNA